MGRYHGNNRMGGTQQATGSSFSTNLPTLAVAAATATLCRGSIIDISFGPDGAPNNTDCQVVYDLSRITTAGTATAITPNPLDNALGAAGTVMSSNFTVIPTITSASSLYMIALNQRASLRVFFDQGLRWPATNLAGICMRALSPTYTGNTSAAMTFDE